MSDKIRESFTTKLLEIKKELERKDRCSFKAAFTDLRSEERYDVGGDEHGWAASIIKVPVMISVFREIDKRRISLEDELPIDHKFTLEPSSSISYRQEGEKVTIEELLYYMILASCNESTNMLADKVGIPKINECTLDLGCAKTRMSHLIYRGAPLVDQGIDGTSSNTTTPNDMNNLMELIYKKRAASRESCEHMIKILENDESLCYSGPSVNDYARSSLPYTTKIGAKTGLLDRDIMETAAINYDYILTVMINKVPPEKMSLCKIIIKAVYKGIFEKYY